MDKLYKRFQERAFGLLSLLLSSLSEAVAFLRQQIQLIIPACLKNQQPSRLTTLEALEAEWDPMLDVLLPAARNGGA